MGDDSFLTIAEAARALGTSTRHARRLAESGAITKVARGLVDADSVRRHVATRYPGTPRSWETRAAWAAIGLLAGHDPLWLGETQTSRLRARLRSLDDSSILAAKVRNRARVRKFTAPRARLPRIRDLITPADPTLLGLSALAAECIDGYIGTDDLTELSRNLGLREDPRGPITLRISDFNHHGVHYLAGTRGVAALDAAASADPRIQTVGLHALDAIRTNF